MSPRSPLRVIGRETVHLSRRELVEEVWVQEPVGMMRRAETYAETAETNAETNSLGLDDSLCTTWRRGIFQAETWGTRSNFPDQSGTHHWWKKFRPSYSMNGITPTFFGGSVTFESYNIFRKGRKDQGWVHGGCEEKRRGAVSGENTSTVLATNTGVTLQFAFLLIIDEYALHQPTETAALGSLSSRLKAVLFI